MINPCQIITSIISFLLLLISSNTFAADMCGEKTLERQTIVAANQSYCLTDFGHYLWVYIPLDNSNVTITTSGGSFVGSNGASIELFSDESWDNDKEIAQVDTANSNEETLSFISGVGNHYFTIGGNVSELTLLVAVTGGDIPEPLGEFIVFDTDIVVDIPMSGLTSKTEFSAIVNQIIAADSSDYRSIAEDNIGSISDVAQAIHFIAEQGDISDTDFTQLMPFIESYQRYGEDVNDAEALAVNNALIAVASMTNFLAVSQQASALQLLYIDALYIFEKSTLASYYSNHLPYLLAIVQFYSLQINPFDLDGAIESMTEVMRSLRFPLSSETNGIINAFNKQMLDVLSVLRSFTLLGETSLDRRWTSDYDLTWFTYNSYYLLGEIYLIANEDAQSRIDGIFIEIHQNLIPEVSQLYLEGVITEHFIERASRECSVDDALFDYCWAPPKEEDILTVSYACSANLTIRAQASISTETLIRSCEQMATLESNFHSVFSTQGASLVNDYNNHLEVVVFASPDDYEEYAGEFFGIDTDNGGIYLEGTPSDDGNQARFIAMQCPEDWVGYSCEMADDIYNLEHEFVHYLDGRYIKAGGFGDYDFVVAWSEGLAEYIAHGTDHTRTLTEVDGLIIPPFYNVLFMYYGYDELYLWAYFAIWYLAQEHPEELQLLADTLMVGDNDAFTAALRLVSDNHENDFERFVLDNSTAVAPVTAETPQDNTLGSCDLEQQYARKYDAATADSLTVTNNTEVPISLFWIDNTTGIRGNSNYKTLALGESYTATYWLQTDRLMLTDSNRNCVAVAVLTSANNDYTIEAIDVENVVAEILPEADELGSCQLMQPHIPLSEARDFTITNTTDYPVHIFRVDDETGEPIYSNLYDTLASGDSYSADFWYGNRRIMLADSRLNCLAVAVTDNLTANYFIDESIVANAAPPEVLPADNTIGSCDLMEKHLIDDVSYTFNITNSTDTTIKIYRVDSDKGDMINDYLYDTLAQGETFTADYWFGLRRVVITDDNDQCLGIAILNQKDVVNEFVVTDEHIVSDSDGDGVVDEDDAFPLDPTETTDTDGDGVGNNADAFPED
ncbi:MAG: collagenase, partial [Colwellia sp.]|nr:collagenase [Colwellia sp.]